MAIEVTVVVEDDAGIDDEWFAARTLDQESDWALVNKTWNYPVRVTGVKEGV